MKILLIILSLLAIACLIMSISLWRSSHYPGAEIGNMDGGLAKIAFGAFIILGVIIVGIIYLRR
jgi:hypothetical protein